jgi:hypothetical protein
MKIDLVKARHDLAGMVARIRELKRRRAEPRQPHWTACDAHALIALKRESTLACAMLAHRRGRLHLRALGSLEAQAELLGDWWRRYALPGEEGPSRASC